MKRLRRSRPAFGNRTSRIKQRRAQACYCPQRTYSPFRDIRRRRGWGMGEVDQWDGEGIYDLAGLDMLGESEPQENYEALNPADTKLALKMITADAVGNEIANAEAGLGSLDIENHFEDVAAGYLEGLEGLDGFFKKAMKKFKKFRDKKHDLKKKIFKKGLKLAKTKSPVYRTAKALGIKEPKIVKEFENSVEKVSDKVNKVMTKAAPYAAVAAATYFTAGAAAPAFGALAAGGGAAGAGTAGAVGLGAKIAGVAAPVVNLAKKAFAQTGGASKVVASATETGQVVKSQGWFDMAKNMVQKQVMKETGINLKSPQADQVLGAAIKYQQEKMEKELQREKEKAIAEIKRTQNAQAPFVPPPVYQQPVVIPQAITAPPPAPVAVQKMAEPAPGPKQPAGIDFKTIVPIAAAVASALILKG